MQNSLGSFLIVAVFLSVGAREEGWKGREGWGRERERGSRWRRGREKG